MQKFTRTSTRPHRDIIASFVAYLRQLFVPMIRPHGRFLSTFIITHKDLLVHTDVSFPLSWSIQANPSTRTFSYHWHSAYWLNRPRRNFTFSCCGLHRPNPLHGHSPHSLTRPQRRFLASARASTGQLDYRDIFFLLT